MTDSAKARRRTVAPDRLGVEPRPPWWRLRVPLGPLAAAYLLIILVGFLGFTRLDAEANARCEDNRAGREVLRQLVQAADSGGGGAIPLTKLPGFAAVEREDPATAAWIVELEEALTPPPDAEGNPGEPPPSRFVARALELAPPITCP